MNKTFEITIGEDLDGFLGYDSEAIAQIDVEASQEAYETAVAKQVFEMYPEIKKVHFAWGGNSNWADWQYAQEKPVQAADEMQWDLEAIEERVYNGQDFWVMK